MAVATTPRFGDAETEGAHFSSTPVSSYSSSRQVLESKRSVTLFVTLGVAAMPSPSFRSR